MLILGAVISGIIIDAFSADRAEKTKIEEDDRDFDFVSGLPRSAFDNLGHQIDFDDYRKQYHDPWNYLYYTVYLEEKPDADFTGQESYICKMVKEKNASFFPTLRAGNDIVPNSTGEDGNRDGFASKGPRAVAVSTQAIHRNLIYRGICEDWLCFQGIARMKDIRKLEATINDTRTDLKMSISTVEENQEEMRKTLADIQRMLNRIHGMPDLNEEEQHNVWLKSVLGDVVDLIGSKQEYDRLWLLYDTNSDGQLDLSELGGIALDALRRSDDLMTEKLSRQEARGDYDRKKHDDLQKAQQLLSERLGPLLKMDKEDIKDSDFVQVSILLTSAEKHELFILQHDGLSLKHDGLFVQAVINTIRERFDTDGNSLISKDECVLTPSFNMFCLIGSSSVDYVFVLQVACTGPSYPQDGV